MAYFIKKSLLAEGQQIWDQSGILSEGVPELVIMSYQLALFLTTQWAVSLPQKGPINLSLNHDSGVLDSHNICAGLGI